MLSQKFAYLPRAKFFKHVKFMCALKLVRANINTFSRTSGTQFKTRACVTKDKHNVNNTTMKKFNPTQFKKNLFDKISRKMPSFCKSKKDSIV